MPGTIKSAEAVATKATEKAEDAVADSAKANSALAEAKAVDAEVVAKAARVEADKVN